MNKIIISSAVTVMLIGCATADINSSNKGLVFKEGKPYAVPYGANYGLVTKDTINDFNIVRNLKPKPTTNEGKKIAEEMLAGANIALKTCKVGDVRWADPKSYANENNVKFKMLQQTRAFATGKAGCVKPLSKQEYDYYMTITRARVNTLNNNQESSNSSPTSYKAPTYNFPSNNNIESKKSSNTYYMNSDGTSTNKVGNTYFHSNGTSTIGI